MANSKILSESDVRAISQALGDTEKGLSNAEIDDLLVQCKIPDEVGPGTKWKRIHYNLWNHQVRVKNRTNVLEFIRQAMKPARHLKRKERFEPLRASLNTALAFSGLLVDETGELKSTKVAKTISEAEKRAAELRSDLESRGTHPDVLAFCKAELLSDDYFHATQEAVKSVFDKLRRKTGLTLDGAALVEKALLGDVPLLRINPLKTQSEISEQKGFGSLVNGIYGMFRTPTAHEARIIWGMKKKDAEDLLSVASLIHRRLDTAQPNIN